MKLKDALYVFGCLKILNTREIYLCPTFQEAKAALKEWEHELHLAVEAYGNGVSPPLVTQVNNAKIFREHNIVRLDKVNIEEFYNAEIFGIRKLYAPFSGCADYWFSTSQSDYDKEILSQA